MKHFIFTIAALVTVTVCSAQSTILQAEYFWDTDPGYGLGTPVLATDGTFNSAFEQLTKTGITAPSIGLHVFNIRIKDNVNGWGPVFRNVVSVQTTLGTADLDLKSVALYPNPIKDVLNISSEETIAAITIYNLVGQEVLSKSMNVNEGTLDVSNLATGTYILQGTTSEGRTFNKKIIKQ